MLGYTHQHNVIGVIIDVANKACAWMYIRKYKITMKQHVKSSKIDS